MLVQWMEDHNRKNYQQICPNGNIGSQVPEEDPADSKSLHDPWTSDCMASMICAMGQNQVDTYILYHLLAHVDISKSIPELDHINLLEIAVKIRHQMDESEKRSWIVEGTNMELQSAENGGRNDPVTQDEVPRRDQHRDVAEKIWNSKDQPQSQADLLLFEAMACGGVLLLENYFLSLSTSTDDARYGVFHRILLRISAEHSLCHGSYLPSLNASPSQSRNLDEVDTFQLIAFSRRCMASKNERMEMKLPVPQCCCLSEYATRLVCGKTVLTRGLIRRKGISVATFHLLMAICSCQPLQEALRIFPELAREKDARGRTALMAAAISLSVETFRIIIRALGTIGEDASSFINEISEDGFSVFSYDIYGIASSSDLGGSMTQVLLDTPGVDPLLLFHKAKIPSFHDLANRGDGPSCLEWRPFTFLAAMVFHGLAAVSADLLGVVFKALLAHPDRTKLSRLVMECFVDDLDINIHRFKGSESQLLAWCCQATDTTLLQSLLECCPDLKPRLHLPDSDGVTMLVHASLAVTVTSNTNTVDFLLNTIKVDPKFSDERGRTALSRLAKKLCPTLHPHRSSIYMESLTDAIDAAALLVKSGADPLAEDDKGFSALSYAIMGGTFEIHKWIDGEHQKTKVHGGIFEGSIFYRLLYDESTPLEEVEGRGEKLLDLALEADNHEAVRLLLKRSGRAGFWANRPKLKTSRRFSCDFYPPVELDDGSDASSQVSTDSGDDWWAGESEDDLAMDARSDTGIGNGGDDAKELSLGSRPHFSAGGVAVSDLLLLPTGGSNS